MRLARPHFLAEAMLLFTAAATAIGLAASLGGISDDGVGAGTQNVLGCDTTGVSVNWTPVWNAGAGRNEIQTVTVGTVDNNCDGGQLRVTLSDSGNNQITEGTLTLPIDGLTSFSVDMVPDVAEADVARMHVAISG